MSESSSSFPDSAFSTEAVSGIEEVQQVNQASDCFFSLTGLRVIPVTVISHLTAETLYSSFGNGFAEHGSLGLNVLSISQNVVEVLKISLARASVRFPPTHLHYTKPVQHAPTSPDPSHHQVIS